MQIHHYAYKTEETCLYDSSIFVFSLQKYETVLKACFFCNI